MGVFVLALALPLQLRVAFAGMLILQGSLDQGIYWKEVD